MFTSRWMKKKNAYDFQTLPVFLMPEIHTFQSFAFAFQTLLGEEWCIFFYLNFAHHSVECHFDKWFVKVTVVEHLRRSENTNVFLSLLPNFANTSPHFCKFCPLTKSLCRRQGAKSDRTVEQVEQLVKKKRPVIRFEKTNAFFTRPPDSAVAAVQVKVDRGEGIITERGTTFFWISTLCSLFHIMGTIKELPKVLI